MAVLLQVLLLMQGIDLDLYMWLEQMPVIREEKALTFLSRIAAYQQVTGIYTKILVNSTQERKKKNLQGFKSLEDCAE